MSGREGIIQYELAFTEGPPVSVDGLPELIAWRRMLRLLGLLGQDAGRYGGFGFGNISLRLRPQDQDIDQPPFVITGSQTGHLVDLGPEGFCLVTGWDIDHNRLEARGPIKPSSEALTHAAVYEVDGDAECVMHVHSPEIWRGARALALPRTPKAATYGTPKMAREVQHVVTSEPRRRIVVMRGHQDGVVAWGANPEAVGLTLLAALVQAFRLER